MRYTVERLIEELKKANPKDFVDYQVAGSIDRGTQRIEQHPGRVVIVVKHSEI